MTAVKLSELPRLLRDRHGVQVAYRRLYLAVLDGLIPAHRDRSGARWLVNLADVPAIASSFGGSK